MKQFGDVIEIKGHKVVVVRVIKKRKWTYYDVVFDNAAEVKDWYTTGFKYQTYREDKL